MTLAVLLLFLQMQTREINQHTPECLVEFKYPEIANDKPFNLYVQQTLTGLVKSCRDNATVASGEPESGSYLQGTYTASTLKTGIVTVLFTWGMYITGAAHPGPGMTSINYDPSTHRVLRLSDLFRPGVSYMPRLLKLAANAVSGDDFAVFTVRHSDFNIFVLTDTVLVLHFPGGPAGSEVEAKIPLTALASIMRKRYLTTSTR